MSLHLILGNSGGGKTHTLYDTVIREACAFPDRIFLVIVPEQFTLETQRELVEMCPGHSLMNIDILSFQRLGHRLLEEAGIDDREILDETGKNFILRRIADRRRSDLKVLGAHLDRMGMIDEIKSFLSELMQYNLTPEDVDRMIDEAPHTSLKRKLEDIRLLYADFLEEIDGWAMTAEGLLTQMGHLAADSALLKDSVIALDGYTGFTPVQVELLAALMQAARDLYVTVTIDTDEGRQMQADSQVSGGLDEKSAKSHGSADETTRKNISEHTKSISSSNLKSMTHTGSMADLFYLSRRTIRQMTDLAAETGTEMADPVYCRDGAKYRFCEAPQLYHLEQHLFRRHTGSEAVYKRQPGEPQQVSVRSCTEPHDELIFCLREIKRQVTAGDAVYGDFAVMTGDLSRYEYFAPALFAMYEVPYFLDRTKRLDYHPLSQAISALLQIISDDFSYRSVFGFLRSGFGPLEEDEIDRLENHVLAAGIRGYSAWRRKWRRNPLRLDEEALSSINELRERFAESIAPLWETLTGRKSGRISSEGKTLSGTAREIRQVTRSLYQFLVRQGVPEELERRAEAFRESADPVRAREEEQIWPLLMQILERLTDVLGDTAVSAEEYRMLLEAGFSASSLRVAPPRKDTVVFGDMERTRLNHVKTLFLIGANDGVIPSVGSEGGILSEFERQSLKEAGEEMAYSAREKALLQKFYFYQNLTKPERSLQITYAQRSSDGTALRRSSLVAAMEKLYEEPQDMNAGVRVTEEALSAGTEGQVPSEKDLPDALLTAEAALEFFAYEAGTLAETGHPLQSDDADGDASARCDAVSDPVSLWRALAVYYKKTDPWRDQAQHILEASCSGRDDSRLQPDTSRSLYGEVLRGSVSRLEQYADCPFSHFAKYALSLGERKMASFEVSDMGDLLHDAIRNYTRCVQEAAYDPEALSDEERAAYFRRTDRTLRPFHDVTDEGIDHYAYLAMNMVLAERAADLSDANRGTEIGSVDDYGDADAGPEVCFGHVDAGTGDRLLDIGAGSEGHSEEPQTDADITWELTKAAFDTASDRQIARRLQRIFQRTAHVVTEQVKAGAFEPERTEAPFRMKLELSDGRSMMMNGRIDRVDTAQIPRMRMGDDAQEIMDGRRRTEGDACCDAANEQPGAGAAEPDSVTAVRIVDYKSSETEFRVRDLYEGNSLQLPLYLAGAVQDMQNHPGAGGVRIYGTDTEQPYDEMAGAEQSYAEQAGTRQPYAGQAGAKQPYEQAGVKQPYAEQTGAEQADPASAGVLQANTVPAGMFYYAMIDPILDEEMGAPSEERDVRLKKKLRLSGSMSDHPEVLKAMDDLGPREESGAVRLVRKKDGAVRRDRSDVCMQEDFALLPAYAQKKAAQAGDAIADGDIRILPYRSGDSSACTHCLYQSVCGFDRKNPLYQYRESDIKGKNAENEAMRRIREEAQMQDQQP